MKTIIGRIRTAPLLAVLIALAAGGAGASVTADAVWEGGFTDGSTKTGASGITYKLNLRGNTSNATGATLPITAATGAQIALSASSPNLAVLVKYSALNAAPTKTYELAAIRVKDKGWPGLRVASANGYGITGFYEDTSSNDYGFSITPKLSSTGGYFLLCHQGGSQTGGYAGSTLQQLSGGTTTSLKWGTGGTTLDIIVLGGPSATGQATSAYSGLVIEKVAIFNQVVTGADLATYAFPSEDPATTYDYTATISANTTFSDITWTTGTGTPGTDAKVYIEAQNNAVLTIGGTFDVGTLWVNGGSIAFDTGTTVSSTKIVGAPINIATETVNFSDSFLASAINTTGACTINFTDCEIYGGITAAQNGDATINTYGNVVFGDIADNYFKYRTTFCVKSGSTTTYNSKSDRRLWCTVRVEKNATLINERKDSFDYNSNASYPIHAYIYGTLTLNQKWIVGKCARYIHLYDGALINGSAENALHSNISGYACDFIAEEGTSTITAPFVKGDGTINVVTKENAMLVLSTSQALAKSGAGTLRIKNTDLTSDISGSEGVLELYNDSGSNKAHSGTISFSGTIKATRENSSNSHNAFGTNTENTTTTGQDLILTGMPKLVVAGSQAYLCLNAQLANQNLSVKNLTYEGDVSDAKVDPVFNGGTSTGDMAQIKTIKTKQTEDTICNLIFNGESNRGKRQSALYVYGDTDAVHSLTLTKESITFGPLTVENYGKVIFSGSGKWANGTVTVGVNGVLEAQHTAALGVVTLQDGATIVVPTVSSAVVPLTGTTVTLPTSGTVNVDLTGVSVAEGETVTVISATTLENANASIFHQTEDGWRFSVDNNTIKATKLGTVAWSDGTWSDSDLTGYASASITASGTQDVTLPTSATFDTLTITGSGTVSFSSTDSETISVSNISIGSGVTLDASAALSISAGATISGEGTLDIPVGTTCTMNGVTCSAKVTVEGTLQSSGATVLSAANEISSAGLLKVLSDQTTLSTRQYAIKGNLYIAAEATLKMSQSLDSSGQETYYAHLDPNSSTTLDIYGTLNLDQYVWLIGANNTINLCGSNSSITGWGRSSEYGNLGWTGAGTLNVTGNSTINANIRTADSISPLFNVAENVTLTISSQFIPQNTTPSAGGTITKAGAGTLKLSNIAMTKPIMAGTGDIGTVELTSTSGNKEHTATGATFNGILHLTNTSSNQHIFKTTAAAFADGVRPEWILDSSDTYFSSDYYPGKVFYVRNLSGSGTFKAQYTSGNLVYTINTMQERNTVFSGIFTSADSRSSCLTVVGDGSGTVNSLTLQNASSSTNTLTVSDNAKVVFASNGSTSGKWANGRVVVNANGWLESSISDAVKNLTLANGSHLVFPTESTAWTGITNITSTGTIDCSIGNGNTPAVGAYLINWTGAGLASAPGGTYSMSGAAAATVALMADTTGLKVVSPAASLTKSTGVTSSYADTMSALADFINSRTTDIGCYVTILDDSEPLDAANLRTYRLVYDSSSKTYRHAVARIGAQETGVFYSSLATALASAVGGETVTLMFNNTDASITIPANVTLEIPAAYSISGTIAGAGAVDAKADFTPTFGEWTGTFIMDWADTANAKSTKIAFDKYGISGSTVQLNQDYKGWLANKAETGVASDIQPTVILNATLYVADGYSKNPNGADAWKDTTKFSKLKSTSNGQLSLEGSPGGSGYKYYFHIDTLESFEGSITINGNYCLKIGKYNFPDQASASSFVVGTKLVALTYTTGSTIYNSSLQDPATAGIDVAMLGSTIPGNKLVYDTDGFYPAAAAVLISETTNYYKTYAAAAEAAVAAEVRRMTGTDVTGAGSLPSGWYPEGALTGTYVLPVASAEVTIDNPYVYGSTMVVTRYYASLADAIAAVDSEGTVTLMDNTGEAISLGKSIALDGDSYTFSGTFTGSGTVILDGASLAGASSSTWPAGWIGTVWLKNNVSGTQIFPANYGNANSVLKFTGVTGWLANGTTIASAVELEDDGDTKALTLNYTSAPETTLTFKEFRGSGTFATTGTDGIWPKSTFKVLKWDDFDGALSIDRGRLEFGTDTISTDDWCYIYVSSGETVAVPAGKTWYARDGVRVNGTLNVDATATLTHLNGGTGKLSGTGRVVLGAVRSSALAFGTWTGTVALPAISETEGGIHFDWYGKAGSTIEIDKGFSGWLNASSDDTRNVKANLLISDGCQFTIVGTNSGTTYGFAKISGNGNFHLRQTNQPNSFTIGMLDGYSGTIVNDDDDGGTPTTLTIQKVKLAAAPTPGDKLVGTTTPDALTVATTGESGVYVGNTQQSVTLAKGSDGIYAALVSVTKGGNLTTYYAMVSDAMTATGSDAATITLLGNTDSNVSLAVGQSLVTGGFSVGTVSTSAENYHVVNNAGVYTVVLDTYTITIPSVANTTVSVDYVKDGAAANATTAGNITVDAGTSLTATWTAASGYRITAGASQTINPVAAAQTLAEPTVVANAVTFTGYTVEYTADYSKAATISATVSGEGAEGATYTLTAGGNNYNGTYNAGTVTFSNITAPSLGSELSYTISASGAASGTSGAQTETVGNVTSGWVQEDATHNESTGTWETDIAYSDGVATITDNTYTPTKPGNGIVTLETVVKFGNEADPEVAVGDGAQAAVKIANGKFAVYGKTASDGTAGWQSMTVDANVDATYTVKLIINYNTGTFTVSVKTGADAATALGGTWYLATAATKVSSIAYKGTGAFTSLNGSFISGDIDVSVETTDDVAVSSDFISKYLAGKTVTEAAAALAPDATVTDANKNGLNYFKCYALGLDPTKEEDKPIVDVTTDTEGKFVFTVKHRNAAGELVEITPADNVSTTVTLKYGTDASSITTVEKGAASGISPADMFDHAGAGNVLYYKAEVSISAK